MLALGLLLLGVLGGQGEGAFAGGTEIAGAKGASARGPGFLGRWCYRC